jgi:hypothetical protein
MVARIRRTPEPAVYDPFSTCTHEDQKESLDGGYRRRLASAAHMWPADRMAAANRHWVLKLMRGVR